MSIKLPHTCPAGHCKPATTAHNEKELRELFGLRTMPSSKGKIAREQSWCKACRSKKT